MSKISSAQYQSQQKRLPLSTKLEVLKLLDAGSTKTEVAGRYNVTRTAIYKIAKNRKEILKYFAGPTCKLGLKKKINLKPSTNVVLDEILFNWLSQTRQQGIPVNGPLICQTALKINKNIGGPDNFKASDGWLYAFKNRYGVRKRPINGEKVLENTEGAQKFIQKFSNFVKEHGYQDENIFNVDESGLNWKLLPRTTLALGTKSSSPKHKIKKERISVLFCANADGSRRLPLLVIGKSRKPRCFKGKIILPVQYTAAKSAWMNKIIFLEWYKNQFIPFVKAKQKTPSKVLLLLDNCPAHPSAEELNAIDPLFQVLHFPPDVISLIQPMGQGVIEKTKRIYRKNFLSKIASSKEIINIETFLKNFNLADCYCLLASAWQQLSAEILVAAWSKLKQQDSNDCSGQNIVSENECSTNNEVANIKDFIEKIPGYEKCTLLDIEKMLNEDFHDQGWEPQDLQSLTEQVLSKHDFIGPKNDLAEKQNTKSAINVDECNRLDEVVSNCENYKVTEDSVMDIDNDLETPVNVILDNAVVEKNNLINNENSNQKALEAIKVIRHWYSNNCDKNQADVINELKTLDNIEHRIAK